MADTQLVPLSANPKKEVALQLITHRETHLSPEKSVHLPSLQLKREMDHLYQQAWDADIIAALYVLIQREGTYDKDLNQYTWNAVLNEGLQVAAKLMLSINAIHIIVNGQLAVDTTTPGAVVFVPGRRWLPALLDLFENGPRIEKHLGQRQEAGDRAKLVNILSADF